MEEKEKKNILVPLLIGGSLVMVAIAGGSLILAQNKNNTSQNPQSVQLTDTPITNSSYKNGTYTATGNYVSPAGPSSIDVKLEIQDGLVKSVTVTPKSDDETSKAYENAFASGISSKVVGKSIDSISNIGRVNGSSLTTNGFQQALDNIKNQAKS